MAKSLVVNLFGGPGYGKSTCGAYLFSELKKRSFHVELVTEYTKDLWYYSNIVPPYNQAYVFGNQLWRIEQGAAKADIVITDSPLPLSIAYNHLAYLSDHFYAAVMDAFRSFHNLNFLLQRTFDYDQNGRYQNCEESIIKHQEIVSVMNKQKIEYEVIDADHYDVIINRVIELMNRQKNS